MTRNHEEPIRIAAVVATHNRPYDLANRCLRSIESQTRRPDYLVVVDDSDPKFRRINKNVVTDFASRWTRTVCLGNYRTPGASGAWNTALAWLYRDAKDVFVAILDDDDSWEPSYLEKCYEAAMSRDLDMVVAGIVRHDEENPDGRPQSIPDELNAEDFLVGNPHIQGSNLFVRLQTLLRAGGFDESFESTTDRDLCIRLADLGTVKFGTVPEHLVHHHAESSRRRLSTSGSWEKSKGLSQFWRKYGCRMSDQQKKVFLKRCHDVFRHDPTEGILAVAEEGGYKIQDVGEDSLFLIIGTISSPRVESLRSLLGDIHLLKKESRDVEIQVVVLENSGEDETHRTELRNVVSQFAEQGLQVELIDYERQTTDTSSSVFGRIDVNRIGSKSIAVSRTMIQHYVYLRSLTHPGAVAWILDDDSRTDNVFCRKGSSIVRETGEIIKNMKRLKEEGIAIALCTVTGDPPLPFTSCLRTQLVDLYHNMERMARLDPSDEYLNLHSENMVLRRQYHDYYYDLSRDETDQLEDPFWFISSEDGVSVGDAFKSMISELPTMMNGRQVFRPLVADADTDPMQRIIPSIHRGGNTLVFHISSLRDFPNVVPSIKGKDTRRSDMVWCLLNRYVAGRKVLEVPIPVRQDRSFITEGTLDFDKLVEDIQGYAVYSSMQDVLHGKAEQRHLEGKETFSARLLEFSEDDIELAVRMFRKYLDERTLAFETSFLRIIGLLDSFDRYTDRQNGNEYWWLQDDGWDGSLMAFKGFVDSLKGKYKEDALAGFRKKVEDVDNEHIRSYFSQLRDSVEDFRSGQPLITDEFVTFAESLIRDEFHVEALEHLGHGEEGVIFTDGKLVYKLIYHWKRHISEDQMAFISSLVGKLEGLETIYPILEVRRWGEHTCIVYPYEPSSEYKGGRLEEILTFLRECREAGIVYTNVHPDTFVVTDTGLKLIDYGCDVKELSEEGYHHMCRRAYLMYRFHYRKDLRQVMTRALSDSNLPELYRFEHFMRALEPRQIHEVLYPDLLDRILSLRPHSVLDYGCGKGVVCEKLSHKGVEAVGFDIDEKVIERCQGYGSDADYVGQEGLEELLASRRKFDVVVCSIVLCTIEDDDELRTILANIRRLVGEDGRVVLAVCNPFYTTVEETEIQQRRIPSDFHYERAHRYEKTVLPNQHAREDIHRPFRRYAREFLRAGLEIEDFSETSGTDVWTLCYASDFLILQLQPRKVLDAPSISLLIKTCSMEWKSIRHQTRHLVKQLEGPRTFQEKVVVTDDFSEEFLRQYDTAHPEEHRAALQKLLEEGVIDRVVYAPYDEESIRRVNKSWFGVDAQVTHAINGQNVYPTLFGLEECDSDYILQVDSDLLIGRLNRHHDYLGEMIEVLEKDPDALTVSFNIFQNESKPYTFEGPKGDWRLEVRGCLLHKDRLLSILPMENKLEGDRLELPWHRAFDRFVTKSEYRSYRGADRRYFFIHVPNERKRNLADIYSIADRVEDSVVLPAQEGSVDLVGDWRDWAEPKRNEPFVFIICSRNVHPGKFRECWESVVQQDIPNWGAVIIDGASENGLGDYIAELTRPCRDKVTLVRDKERMGLLHSTWCAITHYCSNRDSVIITLDADDALLGAHVLNRVKEEYDNGADVTVGSMLRTDKEADYVPDFVNPRQKRGGNVWQHLRTFKKHLFDRIDVEDLKIDGEWVDVATDWQFMLPIVEMARNPRYIKEKLYYYEPSAEKEQRRKIREAVIAKIVAKQPYPKDGD